MSYLTNLLTCFAVMHVAIGTMGLAYVMASVAENGVRVFRVFRVTAFMAILAVTAPFSAAFLMTAGVFAK